MNEMNSTSTKGSSGSAASESSPTLTQSSFPHTSQRQRAMFTPQIPPEIWRKIFYEATFVPHLRDTTWPYEPKEAIWSGWGESFEKHHDVGSAYHCRHPVGYLVACSQGCNTSNAPWNPPARSNTLAFDWESTRHAKLQTVGDVHRLEGEMGCVARKCW